MVISNAKQIIDLSFASNGVIKEAVRARWNVEVAAHLKATLSWEKYGCFFED